MNTRTQPNIGTQTSSIVLENTKNIIATAATLLSLEAANTGALDAWLLVIDKATAAAANDVPVQPHFIAAGGSIGIDIPKRCLLGIQTALSSTPEKYTPLASTVGWFTTRHI